MDLSMALYDFMDMARDDPRIGPTHISLYMAILFSHQQQQFAMPVSVFSKDLMKKSKIAGIGTYHKCMRELKEGGYIKFIPSYNPFLGSLVYLLK